MVFPQVVFLIQSIDLHPHEVIPRDDAPDPSALDDWEVTEAAIAHPPQRVDGAALGSDRHRIRRHRLRQRGHLGVLAFGKRAHRVAAGEDASQALLVINTSTEPARHSLMHRQACCTVSWFANTRSFWSLTISASFRLITSARSFETG